ncbi:MAG: TonB family protein [Bacteroidales bacterium]|jgi:protein TonB|nr:TonB family protein [Bacteroidales bacterium]
MKALLIAFFVFFSLVVQAQGEYYVNEEKQPTDSAHAKYVLRMTLFNELTDRGVITISTVSGTLVAETEYKNIRTNAVMDGVRREYFPNGKLKAEISYKNGLLHGTVKTYYNTGSIKRHDEYNKAALVHGQCYGMNGSKDRYTEFYTPSSYADGDRALYKFVFLNTYYPDNVKQESICGAVIVRLNISKKGDVVQREIAESLHPELDNEALRVARLITKFTPAKQDGEWVESVYMLRVPFEIKP